MPLEGNQLTLPASLGTGEVTLLALPNGLEVYHLDFCVQQEVAMHSFNPIASDYCLINSNLSAKAITKRVNEAPDVSFQRYLPTGLLFYPAGTSVTSKTPINVPFEIVLVRFPKTFLANYAYDKAVQDAILASSLLYQELKPAAEQWIRTAIVASPIVAHAQVLLFLNDWVEQMAQRVKGQEVVNIHHQDVEQLFGVAALLRNPLLEELPTIAALAAQANRSPSKFKKSFKQVFGQPPLQYHHHIKLSYARKILASQEMTITNLAYQLGYSHPSKFTRAFKQYFNYLPSAV